MAPISARRMLPTESGVKDDARVDEHSGPNDATLSFACQDDSTALSTAATYPPDLRRLGGAAAFDSVRDRGPRFTGCGPDSIPCDRRTV